MHEPDGYPGPNDVAISAARDSGGRLVSFCRLDPRDTPAREARRCLDAGAVGIKLHPRAEQFTIHAGRGIPALGRDTVTLASEFPDARLILAHCGISDLAWLWHELPDHPNVFIDTAWWNPADHIALFALVPPSQIVWASDSPYGLPLVAAFTHARCALQAGVSSEALRSIMGGQIARLVAGEDPLWVGDAPGAVEPSLHPLLDRVVTHMISAMGRAFGRTDPDESLALARLSCAVGEDAPHADICAAVLELLDLYRDHLAPPPPGRPFPIAARFVIAALTVARTPNVPLPDNLHLPPPTRDEAEA
jgi:hypothetical protein